MTFGQKIGRIMRIAGLICLMASVAGYLFLGQTAGDSDLWSMKAALDALDAIVIVIVAFVMIIGLVPIAARYFAADVVLGIPPNQLPKVSQVAEFQERERRELALKRLAALDFAELEREALEKFQPKADH